MKASYNTAKEIAEFYINSGLRDNTDVKSLVNESLKILVQKVGLEKAKEIAMPFNTPAIFTVEGLTSYLEAIEIDEVIFADPFTGRIEHTAYIHLKK